MYNCYNSAIFRQRTKICTFEIDFKHCKKSLQPILLRFWNPFLIPYKTKQKYNILLLPQFVPLCNAAGICPFYLRWFGHPDFLRYCKVLRYLAGSLSHPKNHNLEIFSQQRLFMFLRIFCLLILNTRKLTRFLVGILIVN